MIITDATHLPFWMLCDGSRLLPDYERPADTDTTLRDEGNAWHWLAQEGFEGRIDVREWRDGIKAPNGVLITPQMFEHVRIYLGALWPGVMETDTTWGEDNIFQIRGRADHIGYDEHSDILYIDDGKYGFSIVEPMNNWTLISHAIGWVRQRGCITPSRIVITIHQPRPYHPEGPTRSWTITGDDLNALYQRIRAKLSNPSDMLNTGSHCYKCPKLGNCPAARAANMNAVDIMQTAFSDKLSDEQLAHEIKTCEYAFKLMKNRLDALKDMGKHRVQQGKVLPDFMLERTFSNTTWQKHVTPEMAQIMTGRDLSVRKLVTPVEARARGVPELILDAMTNRVETGVKLVQVDVNRKMGKLTNAG